MLEDDKLVEQTSFRSPTLEDAWFKFGEYDHNASLAQKRFLRRRQLITTLGVVATTLAVTYQILDTTPQFPELLSMILRVAIILAPISISILSTIDTKFNLGLSWIVLRSSAEALKKEIYLYRAKVSPYHSTPEDHESRDLKLAQRVKSIGQRIMETQVNQSGLEIYKGDLPPYAPEGDDGFSDIGWREYVLWRLEDQFNYYRKKSVRLHGEQTRLQWCITTIGGLGTFLAAINREIWVAVTSAISAALISLLEFQRIETTLVSCNQASNDLYNIRTWWRALPPEAQDDPHNLETLVKLTENVIQAENAGWVQEMRDALSDMYGEEASEETSAEESSAEKTSADQTSADQASTDQASTDQTSTDQASTDQTSTDQASAGKTSTDQTSTDQASTDQASAGKTSADQPAPKPGISEAPGASEAK
jgi:SMODS and SLOG-associating 2TM effector domain 1/Protein of unknown function (DUF4231)